jgi:hypothetical protein
MTVKTDLSDYDRTEILDRELSIFWNITPCGPFTVNRRFGRTCHLQATRCTLVPGTFVNSYTSHNIITAMKWIGHNTRGRDTESVVGFW